MEKQNQREQSRMRLNDFIRSLREDIVSGKRQPGEHLPSEKTLSQQYRLSNLTIRKGLDKLVSEGLIAKIPRVGNVVIGSSGSPLVTVKLGTHSSVAAEARLEHLLELFHERFPHIRVQTVPISSESYRQLPDYLTGGIADAVMINYTSFQMLMEKGHGDLLAPLEREEDIYPFLSDGFTYDGALLAQPFIFSPLILCYNRQHFAEKNIPEPDGRWRWTDIIANSTRLSEPGERIGFHCDLLSLHRWPLLLLQTGETFERYGDGRIKLAGTAMMEAIRFCRTLIRELPLLSAGVVTGESEHLLAQGKASMIMTSYFYLNYLREKSLPFDIAPVPHQGMPGTLLLSTGLAINSRSPVKEAAVQLVKFLISHSSQLIIRQHTYSLPARITAAEWSGRETLYRPSRFALFRETIPEFRYFSALRIRASELAAIHQEAKLYWAGLESEEAFCKRVEQMPAPPGQHGSPMDF